jgi:hypothetical protein
MEAMQDDGFAGTHEPEPEVLGALGAADLIGDLSAQNSLGRVMLLYQIDSPLLSDDEHDLEIIDIARGIFIMAYGAEAMKPIYSVERRLKSLNAREPKSNPELYKMWLDKVDAVSELEAEFDMAALEFFEANFNPDDFAEIRALLATLIDEQLKPLESMPEPQSNDLVDEKKN